MPKHFEGGAARNLPAPQDDARDIKRDRAAEHVSRVLRKQEMDTPATGPKPRESKKSSPAELAASAIAGAQRILETSLNKLDVYPEMREDVMQKLRTAKDALENGQQALMREGPGDAASIEKNWQLIQKVEQMLQLTSMDPKEGAKAIAHEVNARKLEKRHEQLKQQLDIVSAKVDVLSKKLTDEYGISPEELVAGGSPKTLSAKFKMWFRSLAGSQQLMDEWRANRKIEDRLIDELGTTPATSKSATSRAAEIQKITEDAFAQAQKDARAKQYESMTTLAVNEYLKRMPTSGQEFVDEVNAVMESTPEAQRKAHGFTKRDLMRPINDYLSLLEEGVPKVGSNTERSLDREKAKMDGYLRKLNLATNPLSGLGASRLNKTAALGNTSARGALSREASAMSGISAPDAIEARPRAKKTAREAVLPPPVMPLPPQAEPEIIAPIVEAPKKQVAKRPVAKPRVAETLPPPVPLTADQLPPKSILEAGAQREYRTDPMSIERAASLVPHADQLWDLASERLAKYPDAEITFAGPKTKNWTESGQEQNAATNYIYMIARYKDAMNHADDAHAAALLDMVKRMTKALRLEGNALVDSILVRAPRIKNVLRGVQSRQSTSANQSRRWSGK